MLAVMQWIHMRYTHAHRHIVHITLIHAFNHKQVCYTHYTQTATHIRLPTISPPIRHQTAVWGPGLLIWLNGCHWGTRFSHLPPSAHSHLSLSLIIRLIWRPSAWLIRTFPEFHLFLAVGMSAFLLLVKMLALTANFSRNSFVFNCIL